MINVSYDADGIRIAKHILDAAGQPVTSTHWLVDTNNLTGYAQVFEERVSSGASTSPSIVRTYTYGTGLLSRSETLDLTPSTFTLRYYAADGHGNVRELTDSSGAVTDTYTYDAFGNLLDRTGESANSYLYCGEQYEADLGLYYLRARYLNPDSGRFWSMDSYEGMRQNPFSLQKFLYADADAVNRIDPSGKFSLSELQMVQNVRARLDKLTIPNVRVVGQKVVKKLVCVTAEGVVRNGPIHHIATNKNYKAGNQFSKSFDDIFDEAGLNLNHWANKLGVAGHKGPHPEEYHKEVLQLLKDGMNSVSVEGLAAEAAQEVLQEALQNALLKIAGRLCNANDPLTKLKPQRV